VPPPRAFLHIHLQGHNFFVQNIRNNENRKRTPKWAVKYGLVDDSDAKRLARNRQWAGRFHDRSGTRVFYDDDGNVFTEQDPRAVRPRRQRPGAERYLGNDDDDDDDQSSVNTGRRRGSKKSKKGKGFGGSSSSISRVSSSRSSLPLPADGRDPYAAERGGGAGSRSNGRTSGGGNLGDEFLDRNEDPDRGGAGSPVYGQPPSGRDPYAAERDGPPPPPKKKGLFGSKKAVRNNGGGDFVRPPGGASRGGDYGNGDDYDPRDPYAFERRAAQRGEDFDYRDGERGSSGAGAQGRNDKRTPQLGDEFL